MPAAGDPPHLRRQFLVRPDVAPRQRAQQLRHGERKRFAGDQRAPADQHQVAADIERRRFARQPHGVFKGFAVGHQRGGGQNAAAVRFHDALVDVRRETEIVGIHHQLFSRGQNRVNRMVRNFLGLARMSFASDWNSRVAPLSDS